MIKNIFSKFKELLSVVLLPFLVGSSLLLPITAAAQPVIEGYYTDDTTLQIGMLAGLRTDDTTKIEKVSTTNQQKLHGVVVNANESPVKLTSPNQKLYVAKSGRFDVLVSNQNGSIAVGDYITPSAIAGIGMKADATHKIVLGKAVQIFEKGKSTVVSTAVLKDSLGESKETLIGRITVDIMIASNPLFEAPKIKSLLPDWLNKFGELVADKPVNPIRMYAAILLLIVTAAISGMLLYSAVRGSMISIGRNPLGKKGIMKTLSQVSIVGLIIFVLGIIGVYLLLKL